MREAFALQKILTFFREKILAYFRNSNANEMLTNDIISFEQVSPDQFHRQNGPISSFSDLGILCLLW